MVKLTKRKGFNFFRSYYDVYNELNNEDKVAFMDALLDRQFLGVKPKNLKGMANFAYISQTNSIDSQVRGYEDKTKTSLLHPPCVGGSVGGRHGGSDTPTLQVEEKEKEKDIYNRKVEFKNSLYRFLDKYDKDMLNNFYQYWTEHNEGGKKMRFEYAKNQPFNATRRLATWKLKDSEHSREKLKGAL